MPADNTTLAKLVHRAHNAFMGTVQKFKSISAKRLSECFFGATTAAVVGMRSVCMAVAETQAQKEAQGCDGKHEAVKNLAEAMATALRSVEKSQHEQGEMCGACGVFWPKRRVVELVHGKDCPIPKAFDSVKQIEKLSFCAACERRHGAQAVVEEFKKGTASDVGKPGMIQNAPRIIVPRMGFGGKI